MEKVQIDILNLKISILKDITKQYPGRTIENIITNLESILKEIEKHEQVQ